MEGATRPRQVDFEEEMRSVAKKPQLVIDDIYHLGAQGMVTDVAWEGFGGEPGEEVTMMSSNNQ